MAKAVRDARREERPAAKAREPLRFLFGENWIRFLKTVDEERIAQAASSLQSMLELQTLSGKRFLDAGSGSGLFSLAAKRLGAEVVSFDCDPDSVSCALALRSRFDREDGRWKIEQGSVLDREYLSKLGTFDIVYSWGVLHHTGDMWNALDLIGARVANGGLLFASIYNDQGTRSRVWRKVKRLYNRLPRGARWTVLIPAFVYLWLPPLLIDIALGRGLQSLRHYQRNRGMSVWRNAVDWIGGYPYEVAKPEEVIEFCRSRGLVLRKLKTVMGGHGCNEFVFSRLAASWQSPNA
jgi:2-polyprenyl-6-hydroxyphenyl methylase/3-demethylubiquinone-9 3-methyltransferase